MKRKVWLAVLASVICVIAAVALVPTTATGSSVFGDKKPVTATVSDPLPVELGMRFSADVDGTVTGVRFFKSGGNTGVHVGRLWYRGRQLATTTFSGETATGWQTATFDRPVAISAGRTYVVSYLAPSGRYASDYNGFDAAVVRDRLRVPASGGVFTYQVGGYPTEVYKNSNYFVDVEFTPNGAVEPQVPADPTNSPSTTDSPSPTASASASTTPSNSPAPSATGSASPSPSTTSGVASLTLPRVAWEGGNEYYKQFGQSDGFADADFFPIGIWWGDFDSDANVKWDKDKGINFYVQLNGTEDGRLLAKNDMYWVGSNPLRNMAADDPAWAGWWLSDETDGRFDPPSAGQAEVQKEIDAQKATCTDGSAGCRFAYANYTATITAQHNPTQIAAAEKYVNMYDGPVSVDGYYYTDPSCDDPNHVDYQTNAPQKKYCRTAASYGNLIKTLRVRDAADGKLKPLWGFLENGAPTSSGIYIQPEQMKGAAWNMIINEARGLVWFNQSFSGSCQTGNAIRQAQAQPGGCNTARIDGMKAVNNQIQSYASVLNTQSYQWTFGSGLNTMLKVKDGSAYVFSMVGLNADPGQRTFTLPPEIQADSVEVLGENRTVSVTDHKFVDSFAKESTVHIYKIKL